MLDIFFAKISEHLMTYSFNNTGAAPLAAGAGGRAGSYFRKNTTRSRILPIFYRVLPFFL